MELIIVSQLAATIHTLITRRAGKNTMDNALRLDLEMLEATLRTCEMGR